jgi:hypothetical protein
MSTIDSIAVRDVRNLDVEFVCIGLLTKNYCVVVTHSLMKSKEF